MTLTLSSLQWGSAIWGDSLQELEVFELQAQKVQEMDDNRMQHAFNSYTLVYIQYKKNENENKNKQKKNKKKKTTQNGEDGIYLNDYNFKSANLFAKKFKVHLRLTLLV